MNPVQENYLALFLCIVKKSYNTDAALAEICGFRDWKKKELRAVVDVDKLREMRDEGMTLTEISQTTGISYGTIWRRLRCEVG